MPIAQSRMIALINAALDYKRAAEQMVEQINSTLANRQGGYASAETLLNQLMQFASLDALMNDRANSQTTIAIEYHHFRRAAKRNAKLAQRAANKRIEDGVIPRARTPQDFKLTTPKDLPPAVALSRPKPKGLDSETQAKVLEESNKLFESGDLEKYCPHCGSANPESNCLTPPCKWHEYWERKTLQEIQEDEEGEFKLSP